MKSLYKQYFLFGVFMLVSTFCFCVVDSTAVVVKPIETDSIYPPTLIKNPSAPVKQYNPKVAALLSAVLPGSGQIYNKRYWKLPIVYLVLGYLGYEIYDNVDAWNKMSFALSAYDKITPPKNDSADYKRLDPSIKKLSASSIKTYKDMFRRDVDNYIIWFLVCWALNVADAAVDAHLKSFDISKHLSLKMTPSVLPESYQGGTSSLRYQLTFGLTLTHPPKKNKGLLTTLR